MSIPEFGRGEDRVFNKWCWNKKIRHLEKTARSLPPFLCNDKCQWTRDVYVRNKIIKVLKEPRKILILAMEIFLTDSKSRSHKRKY